MQMFYLQVCRYVKHPYSKAPESSEEIIMCDKVCESSMKIYMMQQYKLDPTETLKLGVATCNRSSV